MLRGPVPVCSALFAVRLKVDQRADGDDTIRPRTKGRDFIPTLQNWLKNLEVYQSIQICNFFQNSPDFCMRLQKNSMKLSVRNTQDSLNKSAICNGGFGNIEM